MDNQSNGSDKIKSTICERKIYVGKEVPRVRLVGFRVQGSGFRVQGSGFRV